MDDNNNLNNQTGNKVNNLGETISMKHHPDDTEKLNVSTELQTPGLNQVQFDLHYGRIPDDEESFRDSLASCCSETFKCSRSSCVDFISRHLAIINVIRTYNVKDYLLGDIVSGISLGIMTIPGSMGYALLASVGPVYGMYTALFMPIIYIFFGSSRHAAMGVMALSSLLIADVIKRETLEISELIENAVSNDTEELYRILEEESVDIAMLLTLICGVVSLLMGIFHFGFITDYMGDAFVSGWLTGANIRVIVSQIIQLLQLKIPTYIGPFSFFRTVFDIFKNIPKANVGSLIIAVIAFILLIGVKYGINENARFKSKLKVPIPVDLFVVVIATIASYFGDFKDKYGIWIVDDIPTGIPTPRVPPLDRTKDFLVDGFLLAIVGYVIAYMMVKVFAERHNYEICPNQELRAIGMCNIIGGLFSSLASSFSPPRCFFMELTGGKTQVANVISAVIIVFFLFFAGPLLEPMPKCILNVIIITACIPLFEYYKKWVFFWGTNKYDFAIWWVSCGTTLCLSVNMGIMIGIAFGLVTVVFRNQWSNVKVAVPLQQSSLPVSAEKYSSHIRDIPGVKIIKFPAPLYFATLENFKQNLFKLTTNPANIREHEIGYTEAEDVEANKGDVKLDTERSSNGVGGETEMFLEKNAPIKYILIDASCIPFLDTAAAKFLVQLWIAYANVGIKMALVSCNEQVRSQFERVSECKDFWEEAVYPTFEDALNLSVRSK